MTAHSLAPRTRAAESPPLKRKGQGASPCRSTSLRSSSFGSAGHFCIRDEITIILRFERRVCRWESCRMHHFDLRFRIYDFRFETACGLPRTAERPVSETMSLGDAIPLTPTSLRTALRLGKPISMRPWRAVARSAQAARVAQPAEA